MAYTQGSSIKKVLIDGVLHPINDYRIEGTNFAVTQIAGSITVGTPLTAEQLAHITEPVMSSDGCVINAPALGTILIPKSVVFNPAATEDYVVSYVSSPLEGKTYNLQITMDHTTGLPKEAVFAEEEVAAPPTNILKTKLDTYKTEFAKPVAERNPTIVAEAKVFGNDVLSKKPNIIVELDADGQPVEVFHATESPDPTAYYRYVNGKNECIDIYYNNSTDPYTTTDLAFPDLENIYVEKAKEYMEIHTTANSVVYNRTKPVMIDEDTLSFTQVEEVGKGQGVDGIIHYPKSVLFTSDAAFELKFAPKNGNGYTPYTPDAKIEISKDGLIWDQPAWNTTNGITLKADTLNPELGKYSVFIRSDNHINHVDLSASPVIKNACLFSTVSGSNIEVSGILNALWGGKDFSSNRECYDLFYQNTALVSAKNLIFPETVGVSCYSCMFQGCTSLIEPPVLPATQLTEACYNSMFDECTSLVNAPILPATTMANSCYCYMFYGCTALTDAPALPATVLDEWCYGNMFQDCTSLTKAPALPADVAPTSCYSEMFSGCTSLTAAPKLPATTIGDWACNCMFQYCTSLISVPETLPATTINQYGYFYMFQGCTALTKAPALPATTLSDFCYDRMFSGCTSLKEAPYLPAVVLPQHCYDGMFDHCTSLTKPGALPVLTTLNDSCMQTMYGNCTGLVWAASGTPYEIKTADGATTPPNNATRQMFIDNGGTFPEAAGTPKLNTTYYLAV